jgi:hypothetical protein
VGGANERGKQEVVVRARALLRRLQAIRLPPRRFDWTVLTPFEQQTFWDLALAIKDGHRVGKAAENYLSGLIARCPVVDEATYRSRILLPYPDDDQQIKRAFALVFQKFALQNKRSVAVPALLNRLCYNERLRGYDLFERNGWNLKDSDCSSIQPLDQWSAEDRNALLGLYQLAAPSSEPGPIGWQSRFDARRPFV